MNLFMGIILISQLAFTVIAGLYFYTMLRSQNANKSSFFRDSKQHMLNFKKLQEIGLSIPLSEVTRPKKLSDIVGQEKGLLALRAALCSPNPQHVIIYGPPGVGKTAAARVVLEEAKLTPKSPFKPSAKYVEIDATTLRFDDRGIADPLIGSVHDPIYQGAGSYGPAGIPQPKPGAVTKAHGGILFIDEIGELHSVQMNKLLKVLEDRKVFLESVYYSSNDSNIPKYIHEIFQNGLPADFRLVAATTRSPEEIPPAIRSRCVEIFFDALKNEDLIKIVNGAAERGKVTLESGVASLVSRYAINGRDCVNMVQIASGIASLDNRSYITVKDIEWVIEFEKFTPKPEKFVSEGSEVGVINGLAVYGASNGIIMDIEVTAEKCDIGKGKLTVTGIVENEEYDNRGQKLSKKSSGIASIENMLTVLKVHFNVNISNYNIHINFPGSGTVDGPSAGTAVVCAAYSAIKNIPIDNLLAMTGEISIKGLVKPVGGVVAKVDAAKKAGIKTVYIPKDNYCSIFKDYDIDIVPVNNVWELFSYIFETDFKVCDKKRSALGGNDFIAATSI